MAGKWKVQTDGACTGNPGPMGIGVVGYLIDGDGGRVLELSEQHGHGTNVMAEYIAIRRALEEALKAEAVGVEVESDSLVVVRQINDECKCNFPHLVMLRTQVRSLMERFPEGVTVNHIYDTFNGQADLLARRASRRKNSV